MLDGDKCYGGKYSKNKMRNRAIQLGMRKVFRIMEGIARQRGP